MSRFVVPSNPALASAGDRPDDFGGRLVKYLPAELLTIYTGAVSIIAAAKPPVAAAPWIAFGLIVVGLLATVFYFANRAPSTVKSAHLIASPVAFVAWSYAVSSPLLADFYLGWVAALAQGISALIAWSLAPTVPPNNA
jgi:hypothetical protein